MKVIEILTPQQYMNSDYAKVKFAGYEDTLSRKMQVFINHGLERVIVTDEIRYGELVTFITSQNRLVELKISSSIDRMPFAPVHSILACVDWDMDKANEFAQAIGKPELANKLEIMGHIHSREDIEKYPNVLFTKFA